MVVVSRCAQSRFACRGVRTQKRQRAPALQSAVAAALCRRISKTAAGPSDSGEAFGVRQSSAAFHRVAPLPKRQRTGSRSKTWGHSLGSWNAYNYLRKVSSVALRLGLSVLNLLDCPNGVLGNQ